MELKSIKGKSFAEVIWFKGCFDIEDIQIEFNHLSPMEIKENSKIYEIHEDTNVIDVSKEKMDKILNNFLNKEEWIKKIGYAKYISDGERTIMVNPGNESYFKKIGIILKAE